MSHPFGGHPTLRKYLEWLRSEGFGYRTGFVIENGEFSPVILVENPEGKPLLTIYKTPMEEHLAPSIVEFYDRRLKVDSPFAKTPH